MTRPTDPLLSVGEAVRAIHARLPRLPAGNVDVAAAHGRVLRQTVVAERDQPPFDRATMDGIAVAAGDPATRFVVTGVAAAGAPPVTYRGAGSAVEIMTGAVLPEGADCVVPVEQIERQGDAAQLHPDAVRESGRFVHRRGSDYLAGRMLLEAGVVLDATHIAVLVSSGLSHVSVTRMPAMCVIATGDELVDVTAPIAPHLVRRSNDYAMAALLARHGYPDARREHVADDRAALTSTLGAALADRDVVILCGGVSKGRYDYVADVLAELGVECVFHRVAQRPGKPMWFGIGRQGQVVFALPGNPVSALVCLRRYVIDALATMSAVAGDRLLLHAVLQDMVEFKPSLTWFAPASVHHTADATRRVQIKATNTSGDFTALAFTDGFVELPADRSHFEAGHVAPWFPW